MNKLKSHKTIEQIARKHRMDVSFIKKQLDMGEPIENEHTKDHDLAKDIALQHLDEFPDYYTRLKKMEADAKKEHRKFKDVKEEGLRDWFGKSKSKDGKPGWVNVVTGGTCASDEPEEGTPKCVSSSKRASMTDAERKSAARRKKEADPRQQLKSGAAKPTYVSTDKPKKKMNEEKDKPEKGSSKKDACYTKVKSRYDVWPSAYASGALVRCRKVGAANWGNKTESYPTIAERILGEEKCGKGMYWCNTDEVCKPMPKGFKTPGQKTEPTEVGIGKPVENGEKCAHTKKGEPCPIHGKNQCPISEAKEKDHEYSMARSELSTIANATKRLQKKMKGEGNIEAWVQSKITKAADYLDRAADYIDSGEHNVEEKISFNAKHTLNDVKKLQKAKKIGNLAQRGVGGEKTTASRMFGVSLPSIKKEEKLVDKIVDEMKCWSGYEKKGTQKLFGKKYNKCVKSEDVSIEDANGNTFAEVVDLIKPEPIKGFKSQIEEASTRLQSETGNIIAVMLSWRGKVYSIKMFFPQVRLPNRKEITAEIQKVYPDAQVLQYKISTLQPGMPLIQVINSKSKNYLLSNGNIGEETAAWTRKEGKNKKGGLNEKGRKSYEAENPGSDLKAPQPQGGSRRDSFCARMSGMKKKLTSAKTANDPDSRINKSLRAWNC